MANIPAGDRGQALGKGHVIYSIRCRAQAGATQGSEAAPNWMGYFTLSHLPLCFSMSSGIVVYSISSIGSRWGSNGPWRRM
jgi:hypothetical protein